MQIIDLSKGYVLGGAVEDECLKTFPESRENVLALHSTT